MTIDSTTGSSCAALSHEIRALCEITSEVIKYSRARGATAAECGVSEGIGQTVKVRCGDVETIKHNHNKRIGITVYLNYRRGHASTSDFSLSAVRATVDAAMSIARSTAQDQWAGLPDAVMLAREIPDLDLFHPWDLSIKEAIDIANTCESAAFSVDDGINNSQGASVSVQHSQGVFGNSLGFLAGYPRSLHWISCAVIAGSGTTMQRDSWHSSARRAADLDSPVLVGQIAGRRAISRLGAKRITTMQAPVIFEAPVAACDERRFNVRVLHNAKHRGSADYHQDAGEAVSGQQNTVTPAFVKCAAVDDTVYLHRRVNAKQQHGQHECILYLAQAKQYHAGRAYEGKAQTK